MPISHFLPVKLVGCFAVADISWLSRNLATAIFGEPPVATFYEALEHFLEAERLAPGEWKKNQVLIGRCFLKCKNAAVAKEWLEKALVRLMRSFLCGRES